MTRHTEAVLLADGVLVLGKRPGTGLARCAHRRTAPRTLEDQFAPAA